MRSAAYKVDEKQILDTMFNFLANSGLENISIRELSRGTGYAQGSIYYWFGDKTNIVCETTEYGFKKVTDEIFKYVFESLGDLRKFFSECLNEIDKYKKQLCFVYQMAASPVYGEKMKHHGKDMKYVYDKYAEKLGEVLNCDVEKIKPLVYLCISAILDYAVWEDRENSQAQLEFIYEAFTKNIENYR